MSIGKFSFIFASSLSLLSSCSDSTGGPPTDLAGEFGENWPFTVNTGEFKCIVDNGEKLALFVHDGTEYAINTFARQREYPRADPILKDHPSFGTKVNIPLSVTRAALNRCESAEE
ncbi:hypothetical protein [Parahaliea mediterranea]|uniref:DUF2511 domain-containing protein n=1 Tax=Parahaliea mediterranea TaxID=651086 RepID=A0A939DC18_9GAMM|nr:hypothetical protein [Parahaliea mediterranea]MBN7795304.1 hypothetical protein [Parahaliea mediterranea]